MNEKIVYMMLSKGGGIDGMDRDDKPDKLLGAYLTRQEAEKDPNLAWRNIEPVVVDFDAIRTSAIKKLNAIDKLVLGL